MPSVKKKNKEKKIMSISIIVAIAENNAIGKNNELLWYISEDLKRFKRITSGHKVIMGRNTYLSLPIKPLPGRTNIVISDLPDEKFEGCTMLNSIEQALEMCQSDEECFVIGGGMVYKQFLPHASKLYITRVYKSFEADTFFPEINYNEWEEIERETNNPDGKNDFEYAFIIYRRK
jgi:dihydrofolate reductase